MPGIDISADVFPDDEGDGDEHSVRSTVAHTVADAGLINLFADGILFGLKTKAGTKNARAGYRSDSLN